MERLAIARNVRFVSGKKPEAGKAPGRFIGLDVIRAIAILLVVVYHSSAILLPLKGMAGFGRMVGVGIHVFQWLGPLGVELFFVLSGFLIGRILMKSFLDSERYDVRVMARFWIKRWCRTIPTFYFFLLATFLLYNFLHLPAGLSINYFLFVQNWAKPHPEFFNEAWSLAVEEWFYLTVPVFLYVGNFFLGREKVFKYTILFYLCLFALLRLFVAIRGNYVDMDSAVRKVVLFRLDSVMYGVGIAYLMRTKTACLYKNKGKLLFIAVLGLTFTTALYYTGLHKQGWYAKSGFFRILIDSTYYTASPFFFALVLPYAYFLKDLKPAFIKTIVLHVSRISYSMYLSHYALIYIPFFKNWQTGSASAGCAVYCLYWLVVAAVSFATHKYIEIPTTNLRERVVKFKRLSGTP